LLYERPLLHVQDDSGGTLAAGTQPAALPQKDPNYIDNIIDRVGCAPLAADRYVLKWKGGKKVILNDDIDWTKTSKALPSIDVEPSLVAAQAKAAEWKQDAIKLRYDCAVMFYRGEGGAILPTWYSPETAPTTYDLIMEVHRMVGAEGRAAERFFRSMRNGMIVAAILGTVVRVSFRWFGDGGPLESTPSEPTVEETSPTKAPAQAPADTETVKARPGRPAAKPEAPRTWKGRGLNEFGERIRWPARNIKTPNVPGRYEIPVERVNLDDVRALGVDEAWARQQAQVYRDIANSPMGANNPSARLRSDWLERLADRLRDTPPRPGSGP
jgi:hypothetical protein